MRLRSPTRPVLADGGRNVPDPFTLRPYYEKRCEACALQLREIQGALRERASRRIPWHGRTFEVFIRGNRFPREHSCGSHPKQARLCLILGACRNESISGSKGNKGGGTSGHCEPSR